MAPRMKSPGHIWPATMRLLCRGARFDGLATPDVTATSDPARTRTGTREELQQFVLLHRRAWYSAPPKRSAKAVTCGPSAKCPEETSSGEHEGCGSAADLRPGTVAHRPQRGFRRGRDHILRSYGARSKITCAAGSDGSGRALRPRRPTQRLSENGKDGRLLLEEATTGPDWLERGSAPVNERDQEHFVAAICALLGANDHAAQT